MTPPLVPRLAEVLEAEFGLSFAGSRRESMMHDLERATGREAAASGPEWAGAEVARRWGVEPAALERACDAVVVTESFFFRDASQMRLLREHVIPDVVRRRGRSPLRVWSAGCAGGEEPYSVAALLEQACGHRGWAVVGTDLSPAALAKAATGTYGNWSLRTTPAHTRHKWFEPDGAQHRVRLALRRRVSFEWLNLVESRGWRTAQFDIVLCRNVLIYMRPAAARRVVAGLVDAMAPDAWLLTASTDPPLEHPELARVRTRHGWAYRRVAADRNLPAHPIAPARRLAGHRRRERDPGSVPAVQMPTSRALGPAGPAPRVPASADLASITAEVRRLGDAGAHTAASDLVGRAIASHPFHAELRYLEAVLQIERGAADAAVAAATAAVLLDPDLVVAQLVLAHAKRLIGDHAGAARAAQRAARQLESLAGHDELRFGGGELAGWLVAATGPVAP